MNSRNRTTLLAILGLALLPANGRLLAQTVSSPYRFLESKQEVGIFAGTLSPGTGRFDLGPTSGVAFGARYGVNFSGPFGLEGVMTYLPTERSIIDPGRDPGDLKVGNMAADMVVLDARLRFSLTGDRAWHGLTPHLLAGGGMAFDLSGDDLDKELLLTDDRFTFGTSFVGVLGGGFRWFPGDRFVVRGDATLLMWRLKTPVGFSDPDRNFDSVDEKQWVSGPSVSLGLGIRF